MTATTPKKLLNDLVVVYREINMLTEDTKALIENGKENLPDETDIAGINKLAKLVAKQKEGDEATKLKGFLSLMEELT